MDIMGLEDGVVHLRVGDAGIVTGYVIAELDAELSASKTLLELR